MSEECLRKSFKLRSEKYCDHKKVLASVLYPERYSTEQGTCWLCWTRLTHESLAKWRKSPYYCHEQTTPQICPVCGYDHWIGSVWYPFKYLRDTGKILMGNPSFRRI